MTLKQTWERFMAFIKKNRIVFVDMNDPNYDKCRIKLQPILKDLIKTTVEVLEDNHGCFSVSREEIDNVAETLLPAMMEFLQSEEGQREFAAWLEKREKEKTEQKDKEDKAS